VIVAVPTFTPVNCGCAAGCVSPCGIVTEAGVTVTLLVSLLARFTVVPPAGAGLDKVTVSVPVWLSTIVAGPERLIVPGGSTVTVAVTSWVTGEVRRMTVVPGATAVTGKLSELHPAFMTIVGATVATDGLVEVAVKSMPPAGAGAERFRFKDPWRPGAAIVSVDGVRVAPMRLEATVNDRLFVAVRGVGSVESVTVTVTVLVPAADGVPVIWPVLALIVKPAGNPAAPHVYGVAPPAAASAAL
jgi:hypothetical protein